MRGLLNASIRDAAAIATTVIARGDRVANGEPPILASLSNPIVDVGRSGIANSRDAGPAIVANQAGNTQSPTVSPRAMAHAGTGMIGRVAKNVRAVHVGKIHRAPIRRSPCSVH